MLKRLNTHPILECDTEMPIGFTFNGKPIGAKKGEVISSALFAHGIRVFGAHHRDGSQQGIFCANGQCAQCLVLADGLPVKSCITPVKEGMELWYLEGLPELLPEDDPVEPTHVLELETEVLIVGAGPAGLSAGIELGSKGVKTIIADDKQKMGGKLTLQTHNFFGSTEECFAGMRGLEIGDLLSQGIQALDSVSLWLNSPVVGIFWDGKVGVVREGTYCLVKPKRILVSAGAREKALAFPGCDLPGVYGAGAFQTLVNRDGVKCAERVLIVGGGNVGLIVAYHALQAGIDVEAVVEALPECGGYKVHSDKIKRLGVPIYTSHTILKAEGREHLERVVIVEVDENFKPISGKEMIYDVDTLLIAVGLSPINELAAKSREYGIPTYVAGDSEEIAEASAAMLTGKISGRKILKECGYDIEIPSEWDDLAQVLRRKPGPIQGWESSPVVGKKVIPVIRCVQEIPCNPCVDACKKSGLITLKGEGIMGLPTFEGECLGCGQCVAICPGLAVTLIDNRKGDGTHTRIILPWEMPEGQIEEGLRVVTTDFDGEVVGEGKVLAIKGSPLKNKRKLLHIEVPLHQAPHVAGIRIREPKRGYTPDYVSKIDDQEIIVCRCERVTKKKIVDYIKCTGCEDLNALKGALRVGLGACGGKTCTELILKIFRELGMDPRNIESPTIRPFSQEIPLYSFVKEGQK